MFKELSNKELFTVTHGLGKTLGADTPLIDIAKLLAESATRLDVATVRGNEMKKQMDAVAAENLALINYINSECFTESKRKGVYTCAGINKPASPATDAMVNDIRAEGLDLYASEREELCELCIKLSDREMGVANSFAATTARTMAANLRAAAKDGE